MRERVRGHLLWASRWVYCARLKQGFDRPAALAAQTTQPGAPLRFPARGEMAEWSKAHAWKVCRRVTVSRVRIPLSPPFVSQDQRHEILSGTCPAWRGGTTELNFPTLALGARCGQPHNRAWQAKTVYWQNLESRPTCRPARLRAARSLTLFGKWAKMFGQVVPASVADCCSLWTRP